MAHEHRRHGGHRGRGGQRRRDPRVARTREVVLEAARKLLEVEGADAVTALRISEATGIARTTIYRHWPDREDLLRDTVAAEEPEVPIPLTGDMRTDLIGLLAHMGEQIGRRRGARLMAVAVDRSGLRGEAGGPHRDMVRRRLDPLRQVINAGIAAGGLPPDLDVDAAVASLAGPPFFRAVFLHQAASPEFVVDVVDSFLASHRI
ncbi:MAG: TetR/AcrR family transcriptional regulator [Acidimicrobiia bacterium]|nr:TetR/AcrR family transcriptional regulator [Acidimicrobiia bacterium]MDX2467904.1 TetR/AcrR family transcriptional regulator [Acidimicrobiia bacterium]